MIILASGEQPTYFKNFDLSSVVTPVDVNKLEELLNLHQYHRQEKEFVINGF